MATIRLVDLICDVCDELYGEGVHENGASVRDAARADGWLTNVRDADEKRDVCPACRPAFYEQERGS